MTALQKRWTKIAERFGLTIRLDERLEAEGTEIVVPVLLEDFGGPRGMVLVAAFAEIASAQEALVKAGFGYACLGEPREGRADARVEGRVENLLEGPVEARLDDQIDDLAVAEMLRDWGWSGGGDAPCWYKDDGSA